jgi:hypothetical protein
MSLENELVTLPLRNEQCKEVLLLTQSATLKPTFNDCVVELANTTGDLTLTLPNVATSNGWCTQLLATSTVRHNLILQTQEPNELNIHSDSGQVLATDQTTYTYPTPVVGSLFCVCCDGTRWVVHGGSQGVQKIKQATTLNAGLKNSMFTVTPSVSGFAITLPAATETSLQGGLWRFAVDTTVANGLFRLTSASSLSYRVLGSTTRSSATTLTLSAGPPAGTIIEVSVGSGVYYVDIYGSGLTVTGTN